MDLVYFEDRTIQLKVMALRNPIIGCNRDHLRAPNPFLTYSNYTKLNRKGFWDNAVG